MLFLASYISYMEYNEISEKIEMDLFDLENPYIPMVYKDKMLFFTSHISYMENNVNEK